ncbi:Uncharacterised protein [Burkholderia oklahomensis]|nr:hypothetical protein BG90_1629 [Burkholderia oklahomensis C6786]SUW58783.1 Uncharacterised protein [Burkholderia oklahomensis]
MQPKHRARDDAERALAADEELLHVIAGVVLQHPVQRRDDRPVREHRFDAERLLAHHPEADRARAARVGREHAADLARAARAEIDAECEAGCFRRFLHRLQRRARAHGHRAGRRVDCLDPGEALHRQHDFTAERDAAEREPSQSALRHDRLTQPRAERERARHVVDGNRPHERARTGAGRFVIRGEIARLDRRRTRDELVAELGDEHRLDRMRERGGLGGGGSRSNSCFAHRVAIRAGRRAGSRRARCSGDSRCFG